MRTGYAHALRGFATQPAATIGGNTPVRNLPVTQRLLLFYAKLREAAAAFSNMPASVLGNMIAQVEDAHGFRIEPNSIQNEATARIPWRGGGLSVMWLARDLDSGRIFYGRTGEDVTDEVPGFLHNNIPRTPNFGPSLEDAADAAVVVQEDQQTAATADTSAGQVVDQGAVTGGNVNLTTNLTGNEGGAGAGMENLAHDANRRAAGTSLVAIGLLLAAAWVVFGGKRKGRHA